QVKTDSGLRHLCTPILRCRDALTNRFMPFVRESDARVATALIGVPSRSTGASRNPAAVRRVRRRTFHPAAELEQVGAKELHLMFDGTAALVAHQAPHLEEWRADRDAQMLRGEGIRRR